MAHLSFPLIFSDVGGSGLPAGGASGQILLSDGAGSGTWANGAVGRVKVVSTSIAYNTANILTGAAVYTPAVGELLLDVWVEVTTAWDGTTPRADIGTFQDGSTLGMFSRANGSLAPDSADNAVTNPGVLINGNSLNLSLLGASALGDSSRQAPAKFTATHPLCICVSQDGTPTGTTPGSTHGAAIVHLIIWSPTEIGMVTVASGLTPTAVKAGAYNAVVSDFVPVDTTSGSVTITLPTAPADGSVIGVKQVTRGGTNTVSIVTGGSDVFNKTGGATTATLTLSGAAQTYQYKATGAIWYVIADDQPYASLLANAQTWSAAQTFVAPVLGVPASGTLTNATGLPAAGVVGTAAILGANTFTGLQTDTGLTTTSPGFYAQITGDAVPRVRIGLNPTDIASLGMGDGTNARDTFLERAAAANVRHGAPDAAAPVAQTISVQNVVAGTSNTAGAAFTIGGSKGTGTGVGGSLLFQVAPAGSTGTTQNALATAFTIAPVNSFAAGPTIQVGSGSTTSQGWMLGYFASGTSGIWSTGVTPSGTNYAFAVDSAQTYINAPTTISFKNQNNTQMTLSVSGGVPTLALTTAGSNLSFNANLWLTHAGAAALQLGQADAASPVAQTLKFQDVVAGTSNTAGVNATIQAPAGTGTGAGGSLLFQVAPAGSTGTAKNAQATALTIDSTKKVTIGAGGLVFPTADPHIAGAWWDSAGTLTKSAG